MTTRTRNQLLDQPQDQTPASERRRFLGATVRVGAVATAAMLLSACGQKGPLYIPGDDKKKKKKS